MATMNKKQIKQFKKISKGTKESPTIVLTTWSVWHNLPLKTQNSKLRNIIVVSDKNDWCEDCWTYRTAKKALDFHGYPTDKSIVVAGDSAHINNVLSTLTTTCTATVLDIELNDEPYEFIV